MRKEKNRTRYSVSLSEYTIEKINDISLTTGMKKTKVIDKAIKISFGKYNSNKVELLLSGGKPLTGRCCFSTSLNKEDIKKIEIMSADIGLSKSEFIEKGLMSLFDIYENDKMHFLKL